MKRLLAWLLRLIPGYRYRVYRVRAARNALTFLWQLNETYDGDEGVFGRLTRAIKGRTYRDDPYLMNFDLWIDAVELRAVREEGGKFGTSTFHDFEFHRRVNAMCRTLYEHSLRLILMFNCEGPLPPAMSRKIASDIDGAVAVIGDAPEASEHLYRFQTLYDIAVVKLKLPANINEADDNIEPERLCLLWLWVLTQVHSAINRVVIAKFALSYGDIASGATRTTLGDNGRVETRRLTSS